MILLALGVAVILVGIDRLTKWLAIVYIGENNSIPVIKIGENEIINLTYCENTGAAFSILEGQRGILIAISSIFLVGALVVLFSGKVKSKLIIWSISLIIAGGVGNLIDRIADGYVVDFIDLKFIGFAIFNFADICAVTGACMLFFAVLRDEIREYKARKACSVDDVEGDDPVTPEIIEND
ncbi:MAG: signal peptidase II [Oscillospiraceae bacterium]|nr:signal peptidase II [Oscillospiraceae bacterium]